MANQFVNLPAPTGNGVGASVDVSTFGAIKTIVCGGNATATINVEVNNDAAQAGSWQSVATFQNTGQATVQVAARWMRVRVSGYNAYIGGTPAVDVGGTDIGATFASLPVSAGTGVGAAVDTSALGLFKSVQVGDAFRGTTIIEVSEDGTTEWSQPFSFQTPGIQSQVIAAKWMRVRRVGVPDVAAGLPVVNVGATDDVGAGGNLAISAGAQFGDTGISSSSFGELERRDVRDVGLDADHGERERGWHRAVGGHRERGSWHRGAVQLEQRLVWALGFDDHGRLRERRGGDTVRDQRRDAKRVDWHDDLLQLQQRVLRDGWPQSRIAASFSTNPETPFGISAGSQSVSTGTMVFANSNGVTFGMSGSSQITASYSQSTVNTLAVGASGGTVSAGTVVFSNSNNISFGMNGSTVTASLATPRVISYFDNKYAAMPGGTGNGVQGSSTTNNLSFQAMLMLFQLSWPHRSTSLGA